MGYDLHITRRRRWSGKGPAITADEWLAFVEKDPELQLDEDERSHAALWRPVDAPAVESPPWLAWSDGEIYTKNPDEPLLAKMVSIATALGATVQGDDGEVYEAAGEPPHEIPLSFMERMAIWLDRVRSLWPGRRGAGGAEVNLPFDVGDRVFDESVGRKYTVIAIDREADHGLGWIVLRADDGSERRHAVIAHGLRPLATEDE